MQSNRAAAKQSIVNIFLHLYPKLIMMNIFKPLFETQITYQVLAQRFIIIGYIVQSIRQNMQTKIRIKSLMHKRKKDLSAHKYFHFAQPFCEQYVKAKQQAYQKARKSKLPSEINKQNYPMFYKLNKPKSGFYALKGCRIKNCEQSNLEKVKGLQQKSNVLNNFLKKFLDRKLKVSDKRDQVQNYTYSIAYTNGQSMQVNNIKQHSQSVLLNTSQHQKRLNHKILLTEPSCGSEGSIKYIKKKFKQNKVLMPIHSNMQLSLTKKKCTI